MRRRIATALMMWCTAISACMAGASAPVEPAKESVGAKSDAALAACPQKPVSEYSLDEILDTLRSQTAGLTSYKCAVRYLFIQDPELLDSRTLRKGILYYLKDKSESRIRVNFDTIKQDEGAETNQLEQFIFDGVWLTKVDYQLKKVDYYQQAEPNKPVDVFSYISHNFPIVGFSRTEDLRKQFDIKVVEQPSDLDKPIRLHLTVKKDSVYKDDYTDIDFWIDARTFLPGRVVSHSTEEDVYDIQFLNAVINKNLENTVFKLETPKGFTENRHPLKKESERDK